jgi:glucose-6-phosphate 1-dehydrogenase
MCYRLSGKRRIRPVIAERLRRWRGVPFYLRAGKCLPLTCTEILVRLRQPPTMFEGLALAPNHCRFRISPDVVFALGVNAPALGSEAETQPLEVLLSRGARAEEMDAYERVLTDAMQGDATLFAREDYVDEAWRIVDTVLKAGTPVRDYEAGTWGPPTGPDLTPSGGWHDPVATR